jgi:hypothetical protein
MARSRSSIRKRRRDSESSSSDYDGDTIAVIPRQAPIARVPLKETQSRGNVIRRSCTTSHVLGVSYATSERCCRLTERSSYTITTGNPTGTERQRAS